MRHEDRSSAPSQGVGTVVQMWGLQRTCTKPRQLMASSPHPASPRHHFLAVRPLIPVDCRLEVMLTPENPTCCRTPRLINGNRCPSPFFSTITQERLLLIGSIPALGRLQSM